MRARRTKAYIRLLDIKALCEFFANTDGYVATFPQEGNKACVVVPLAGNNAEMGKIFFELMIRIKLGILEQFFRTVKLTSIKQFFDGIRSPEFISFVKQHEQQICNAEYVDSSWSSHTFFSNLEFLTADFVRYQEYCDHLYSLVATEYNKMLSSDSDVLGIYCMLPLLLEGMIRRIVSRDSFNTIMSQRSIISGLKYEFEVYCSKLTLADDANRNTVIYKYLADQIQYFSSAWFSTLQYKYITGKVSVPGADDRQIYTADLMRMKTNMPRRDMSLLEVFTLVSKLDSFLFQRSKGIGYAHPYLSITDLVLRGMNDQKHVELKDISSKSKVLCNCTFIDRDALIGVEQLNNQQKSDVFMDRQSLLRHTDMTFQTKIRYNSKLVTDVLDKAQYISFDDFHEVIYQIVSEHTHGRAYKDSDKPCFDMVTPLGYKFHSEISGSDIAAMSTAEQLNMDAKYSILSDSIYNIISDIILAVNKLLELNEVLEAYNTSLAVVWSQYLLKCPNQSLSIFSQCASIASFLNYLGISPNGAISNIHDDGFETVGTFYLQVPLSIREQIYRILNTPFTAKRSPCTLELQLGKAHMPVLSEDDGKKSIQQMYSKFSRSLIKLPTNFFSSLVTFVNDTLGLHRIALVNTNYRLSKIQNYSFSKESISAADFASYWVDQVLSTVLKKPVEEQKRFITDINDCLNSDVMGALLWWNHTESEESDLLVSCLLGCYSESIPVEIDFKCLEVFLRVANSIPVKGIGTKQYPGIGIIQSLDDADMKQFIPSCKLYNILFGFFVSYYDLATSGFVELDFVDDITPLSDMNFILDAGFSSILLRDLIAREANTYVTASSKYMRCLEDVNFNSLFATRTEKNYAKETFYIDIAHALSYVGKSFALMNSEFLNPLKYAGDIVFNGKDSDRLPLENFRASLQKAKITLLPIGDIRFSRNRCINEELVLILAGTVRSSLSTINYYYGNTFRKLHSEDNVFRNYVKHALHLSQTRAVTNKNAVNFDFSLNTKFYTSVFETEAYMLAKVRSMFTSQDALNDLRVQLKDCALDGNYYRQRNGAYVCITNKSNGRLYYLTKDLVYVGQSLNGEPDIRAAAEIQF